MAMTLLPNDFKDFLKLLNDHEADYLLVGGYAVGYHGYPRATVDLDIWIKRNRENAKKLVTIVKRFGFDVKELNEALFTSKEKIIRMGHPPLRIELLTSLSGVDFQECYEHRIVDTVDDVQINIIGLDCLKKNKAAAGRHKDFDDLEHLP